jgi:hypothetical protein
MESSVSMPSALQTAAEKMVKDMKFVGIFAIIYGIIACLTIIGAIFGVPYIFVGIRLREAGDLFLQHTKAGNEQDLIAAYQKQGSSFFIMKVLVIVGLVLFALYIIVMIAVFAMNPDILY